jgi:uroporphyrinogen-III synthase
MPRPPLLLTRPETQSRRFAGEFCNRFGPDWPVILSPLTRTRYIDATIDMPNATAVVFASETAVAAFAPLTARRDLLAWCVGGRTAANAAKAGFRTLTGGGTAEALVDEIIATGTTGPVIVPHAAHVSFDIAAKLNSAGIETFSTVTYAQDPVPLSDAANVALQTAGSVLLPLFSPRAVRLFGEAAGHVRARLLVVAISQRVAAEAANLSPHMLVTAAHPDATSMLDALKSVISSIGTA